MDVMRSDRVLIRFQLEDDDKDKDKKKYHAEYHRADRIFTYLHDHSKVYYEAYHPGKSFTINRIDAWEMDPVRRNKNRLGAIRAL